MGNIGDGLGLDSVILVIFSKLNDLMECLAPHYWHFCISKMLLRRWARRRLALMFQENPEMLVWRSGGAL